MNQLQRIGKLAIAITGGLALLMFGAAVFAPWPASAPLFVSSVINFGLCIFNVLRYVRNERIGLHR